MTMTSIPIACVLVVAAGGPAFAASIVNRDAEPQTIIVTEGSDTSELTIAAGQTVEFCPMGCFVALPDGDYRALTGSELIEIQDGSAVIR